jgi:hypothetical protein
MGAVLVLLWVAVVILMVASYWTIYTKAGQPGWASLIPIYNLFVLLKMVGKPGWWLVLFLVPIVNLVVGILVMIELAKAFGKSGGFVVGLLLLPVVFAPMLAFGDARYTPPAATV